MSSVTVTKQVNRVVVTAPGPQGAPGPTGETGSTGATGATGPTGPAPSGTGLVSVTAGSLDTPATLSDRVAADASNLRTQLGLGTAAVRADADFPRFDADQSPTAAQKRTARFNLGFSDSFTTAELKALSASDSARLRQAWCSDCFTSGASTGQLVGDMCLWVGDHWATVSDGVTPWADPDFPKWALEVARSGRMLHGPFLSVFGDLLNNNAPGFPVYTSGAGATVNSPAIDTLRMFRLQATPGSTPTGAFRGVPVFAVAGSTSDPIRRLALVMSYIGAADSVSAAGTDEWHWRLTIGTAAFSATAALQADEFGFVMDDRGSLGQGVSGANLRAMCRLGSTTLDWFDTGIPVTTGQAFLVVTWEPTGPAATRGRVRLSSAVDFGGTFTTHVDITGTAAAATFQAALMAAKTLGTSARYMNRRFVRLVALRASAGSGGIIS